jgi:hypothetical protein
MTKYILVYKGGSAPTSADDRATLMQAWRDWVGGLGEATVDPGNPFGPALAVAPGGAVSDGGPSELRGYMIFSADNLAAAAELAKGCPHLTTYGTAIAGTVEIYEALPID